MLIAQCLFYGSIRHFNLNTHTHTHTDVKSKYIEQTAEDITHTPRMTRPIVSLGPAAVAVAVAIAVM